MLWCQVNFLLHFRLAHIGTGSQGSAVGAMLPDLWRVADRRVRPQPTWPGAAEAEAPRNWETDAAPGMHEVMAGIRHHLESDVWFHADPVFSEGEVETMHRFRAATLENVPRLALFAHIAWELCLDGALVRREGAGALRAELGVALSPSVRKWASAAADIHHFDRVVRTDDERARFDAGMTRIFDAIGEGPWIEGYATGEGITARIEGIRRAFSFPVLSAQDKRTLAALFDERIEAAEIALPRLFARGGT